MSLMKKLQKTIVTNQDKKCSHYPFLRDSCKTRFFLLLVILSRSTERSEVASEESL